MRFSVKLAPGVRISASSRGLRAHVGPRGARLHVGGGRPGISTGVGPVSFYAPLGARSPARPSRPGPADAPAGVTSRPGTGRLTSELQRSAKVEEGLGIVEALEHLRRLHEQTFLRVTEPVVAPAVLPAQEQILETHLAAARRSFFDRTKRREAEQAARWSAYREIDGRWREAQAEHKARVEASRSWWQRLQACDPDTVWEQLGSAFADNEAAAAPLAVSGTHVDLAVLLPPVETIPVKMPGVTPAGNPSLRKMTKTQTATWYQVVTAGYVLTTADEAFAVAPGLRSATLVGLRPSEAFIGRSPVECVLACTIERHALEHLDRTQSSPDCLSRAATGTVLTNTDPRTGALRPLDLRDEPDLRAVVDSVDLDDLERRS